MAWYKPWTWGDESDSAKLQRSDLKNQADQADAFRDATTGNYHGLSREGADAREMLRRQAMGQDSLSAEQLRQGLQQQFAQQRSFAASASPANQAMAARNAMMNMGRAATGMSGQAALAGIQERAAAQKALADAIAQARQQDLQGTLGAQQNAISATTGQKPEGSTLDKWGGAFSAGLGYLGTRGGNK